MKTCKKCGKNMDNIYHIGSFCSNSCKVVYYTKLLSERNKEFKEKRLQSFREWYKKNKSKHLEYMKKYNRNNEKVGFNKSAYRMRKKIFEKFDNKCQKCGSVENLEMHHLDYIPKEGHIFVQSEDKIVLLCRSCHRRGHQTLIVRNGEVINLEVEKNVFSLSEDNLLH